jgi:hypothetical protein
MSGEAGGAARLPIPKDVIEMEAAGTASDRVPK